MQLGFTFLSCGSSLFVAEAFPCRVSAIVLTSNVSLARQGSWVRSPVLTCPLPFLPIALLLTSHPFTDCPSAHNPSFLLLSCPFLHLHFPSPPFPLYSDPCLSCAPLHPSPSLPFPVFAFPFFVSSFPFLSSTNPPLASRPYA